MAASASGSLASFIFALFVVILFVLLLLRYYLPLRTTPAYVTVPVFLAVALPASIVILLPIDLASGAGTDTNARGIWLSERVLYKSWRIIYWLTFALTWAILPLLGEYCDSGYREPKARLLYALRSNGRYWLTMLGFSTVGLIYVIWQNSLERESFQSLVMALAYAWGLIMGIYLMGHGLVAFPRSLFRYANVGERLKRLQSQAPKVHDKLTKAIENLDQCEQQVAQLKQRKNSIIKAYQEWIHELTEKCSLSESRAGISGRNVTVIPTVITDGYLADLTRKLKRARHAKCRFENEWDHILYKALRTQAILDSKASKSLEFNQPSLSSRTILDRIKFLTPLTRFYLHVHIIPALTYLSWFFTVVASISIVWSECVREAQGFGGPKLSIIGWTIVQRHSKAQSSFGFHSQLIAAAWLCYMCVCAFYSLTEVKIWGNRALVRRNTYQESATWYGLQVAKLTVPLSYNFLTMTDKKIWTHTMFYKFLGRLINISPLGAGFSAFFPIFILVPVLAAAFELYGKIRNVCGFGDLLGDDEEDGELDGSWREGRMLIARELQGTDGALNRLSLRRSPSASPPNERYTDDLASSAAVTLAAPLSSNPNAQLQQTRTALRRHMLEEEEQDSVNFFETFANRVRNTFEVKDISFQRPRWLGGENGVESGARRRAEARGEQRSNGFMSLFGGRPEEGRVRL